MAPGVYSHLSPTCSFNSNSMLSGGDMKPELKKKPSTEPETDKLDSQADGTVITDLVDDTIHYLSPISPLSMRTECEGDYMLNYPVMFRLLEGRGAPEYSITTESTTVPCEDADLQRTLAIIKPDAMKYQDVILRAIDEAGFSIIHARTIHLTPEQVSEIYSQYYGSISFPHLVVSVSMGPILAISLAAVNAVSKWKDIVGPDKVLSAEWFYPISVRVRFGLMGNMPNMLHASQSLGFAISENRYFFPENIIEPLMTDEMKIEDYLNLYVNPTLVYGLVDVVKKKPIDPVMHLAEWLLINNPFQPRYPPEIAILKT